MDKDLKEIENKVEEFCKKYKCTLEINILSNGRDHNGNIQFMKVCSKINN